MKFKLFLFILVYASVIYAETTLLVYYEPAKDNQYRFVIRDMKKDSLVMDFVTPLTRRFLDFKFFSNTAIIGEGGDRNHYIVDILKKTVTQLPDFNHNEFVYNQSVWACFSGDSISVVEYDNKHNYDLKLIYKDSYQSINNFEWILKKDKIIYLCLQLLNNKNDLEKVLLIINGDQISTRKILNPYELGDFSSVYGEVRISPDNNFIGARYIGGNGKRYLTFLDLQQFKFVPILDNVSSFEWINNDSLIINRYSEDRGKRFIELFDLQNKQSFVLFDKGSSITIYNNCLYFVDFTRRFEIFTNIKFMKYNIFTHQKSQFIKLYQSRSSFYNCFNWDIKEFDLE